MSKKKKKINNTAEEIKDVVTETEVSLDELDKFEPDVKNSTTLPKPRRKGRRSRQQREHNRRGRSSRFD